MNERESKAAPASRGKREFRKGNINLDILQPKKERASARNVSAPRTDAPASPETDSNAPEDKRGMFHRDRPHRPVGPFTLLGWTLTFLVSLVALVWLSFFGESLFWLLSLPAILASLLWSLIMLALYQARPR